MRLGVQRLALSLCCSYAMKCTAKLEHCCSVNTGSQVDASQAESEVLLAETRAADMLELELATDLDFGGISTSQVSSV